MYVCDFRILFLFFRCFVSVSVCMQVSGVIMSIEYDMILVSRIVIFTTIFRVDDNKHMLTTEVINCVFRIDIFQF